LLLLLLLLLLRLPLQPAAPGTIANHHHYCPPVLPMSLLIMQMLLMLLLQLPPMLPLTDASRCCCHNQASPAGRGALRPGPGCCALWQTTTTTAPCVADAIASSANVAPRNLVPSMNLPLFTMSYQLNRKNAFRRTFACSSRVCGLTLAWTRW
jgi:hypothetical protein